jgi:type IV pilus assembly protein PilB
MTVEQLKSVPVDSNLAKTVERLLTQAIDEGATAIALENHPEGTRLRYRCRGRWQMMAPPLARGAIDTIGNYLQELAGGSSQGSFERCHNGQNYRWDLRRWQTVSGCRYDLQLSTCSSTPPCLSELWEDAASRQQMQQLLAAERGLLLVVGTSDSGKATTLGTLLAHQVSETKNIWWLPQSSKYDLEGVSIVAQPEAAYLPQFVAEVLSQAPDIVAVDRLQQPEVARQLLETASERLVIASITADGIGTALKQLLAWGLEVDRLAGNLLGLIHQTLLPTLCPHCRLADEPSLAEFNRLGMARPRLGKYYRANSLTWEQSETLHRSQSLCRHCRGSGYQGRQGLYTLVPMQAQIKVLLQRGSDSEEIDLSLRESGAITLVDQAWAWAARGQISLREIQRCLRPSSLSQSESWSDDGVMALEFNAPDLVAANTNIQCQQELEQLRHQYQSVLTELESYQDQAQGTEQRLAQVRQQVELSTKVEIALQLISVLDIIELARNSIRPQSDREAAIQKGYSMLENKLLSTLRDMGVRPIESQGRRFDSRWHEVVEEEVSTHPVGMVLVERKRGFMIGDRVLRLAQVKVAIPSSFR